MSDRMIELGIIDQAIAEHNPSHIFALFSGGHDSLAVTKIASQHPRFSGVVHCNTGIGIEETREFVRDTCREQGWPFMELLAPEGLYESECLAHGMPGGPRQHGIIYQKLKDDQLRRLVREHKRFRGDRVGLVTGIRLGESERRMRVHPEPIRREYAQLWINPILAWSALDVSRFIDAHGLRRNPVVDKLHRSGECLCGALARPQEIEEIAFWYPDVARRIRALERQCHELGLPSRWGSTKATRVDPRQAWLPLCQSCETRWDANPV